MYISGSVLQDCSCWMNYCTLYPIAPKGVWDYFSNDIVRPIHIRIDEPSIARLEQPALDPSAQVLLMFLDEFAVEKAAFRGVTFFGNDYLNADQLRFVGQHVDELGVGNAHKILVIAFPQFDFFIGDEEGITAQLIDTGFKTNPRA